MIYTTCLMCYASFSYSRPLEVRIALGASLTGLAIFITLYYHYFGDPVFHQIAYGILTAIVVLRSMYTMETVLRPKWRKSEKADHIAREKNGFPAPGSERQAYENLRDLKTLRTMWLMVAYGLTMFLGGFLIWNLDNIFCSRLRAWRHYLGLPWGILLEGHGWWSVASQISYFIRSTLLASSPLVLEESES
jgi:dihydroceramidase